jgi:tRNA(fMet)-specific endonuclease VapC
LSFLLDTCIAIELRDENLRALARFAQLSERPVLSTVSQVELEGGVYARPQAAAQRRRRLDVLLQMLAVIPFDESMAVAYGRIVKYAGFSRRKSLDRMIAATALVLDLTLITANASDFSDIDGLKLEVWNQ